jgi:hypothetical protein
MTDAQVLDLLERLKVGKQKRVVRSLDIIHQICLDERAKAHPNLTVVHIGDESQARNGVGRRQIYQDAGRHYKDLLDAHVLAHRRSKKLPPPYDDSTQKGREDYWIREIDAVEIRMMVKRIRAERDRLAQENANLKQVIATGIQGFRFQNGEILPAPRGVEFTRLEIDALRRACDPSTLTNAGLTVKDDGTVVARSRIAVYAPEYLTALRKIIDAHDAQTRTVEARKAAITDGT